MSLLKLLNLPPLHRALAASARPTTPSLAAASNAGGPAGRAPGAAPVSLAIRRPDTIELGTRQRLKVTAILSDGSIQDVTSNVTWTSSDTSLLTIAPGGVLEAKHTPGEITITAAAPGGKPRDSIEVRLRARVQGLVVTPGDQLVELGKDTSYAYLVATAIYADGMREDIFGEVKWESDRHEVLEMMNMGGWTALAPGVAHVRATHRTSGSEGFAKFTVVAAGKAPKLTAIVIEPLNPEPHNGERIEFTAIGTFADKSKRDVTRQVEWESSHPDVLEIDRGLGVAQPMLMGGHPLVRALDPVTGLHASTTVYVEPPDVVKIEVDDVVLDKGDTLYHPVNAVLRGGGRIGLNGHVQWQSDDPGIADFDGQSVVAVGPGTTTIGLSEPHTGATATFQVKVTPAELKEIIVFPTDQTVPVGTEIPYMAIGKLTDGTTRELKRPIWSSSDATVVEIDQDGVATAKKPGDAVVRVESRATHRMQTSKVTVVS